MSNEEKAVELISQAEKKVKSSQGFFGGLFGYVNGKVLSNETANSEDFSSQVYIVWILID